MYATRVLAVALAAAAIGMSAVPALASSSHWKHARCQTYANRYRHASASQKSAANRTLRSHGCSVRVK